MSWEPDQATLQHLLVMLEALGDPLRHDHREAMGALDREAANPVFVLHLMHVLGRMQHAVPPPMRQLAGFIVKNRVFPRWSELDENLQSVVQTEVLHALVDELPEIRNVAGSAAVMIVRHSSPELWMGMLEQLLQLLDSNNVALVETCTNTLFKLCEDHPAVFDSLTVAEAVIPRLFGLFQYPQPHVRALAVKALNAALHGNPNVLLTRCDDLLNGLATLSADPDPEVRVAVWETLITLMVCEVTLIVPALSSLCVFLINSLADPNASVAMQACDFWVVLCDAVRFNESDVVRPQVQEYIPAIVEHLVTRMVYTEDELQQQRADRAAEASGEKMFSMRPMHLRRSEEDEPIAWTLRNFSSAALDKTSVCFPSEVVLPALLPVLQDRFNSTNVWVQEAGLLAFGAVASGCFNEMGQYLPDLLSLLQGFLTNPVPEVRRIACWCFSRYAPYFLRNEQWYEQLLQLTLQLLLDDEPIVQESACTTLISLCSSEVESLANYARPILETVHAAFSKYGFKNFFNLCDVLATLADSIGAALANDQYVDLFLPIIMDRIQHTPDDEITLIPLLECLTSVVQAIGVHFQNYAIYTFERAMKLIRDTMVANAIADEDSSEDAPLKDFIVVGLDVCSGMAQGFGTSFELVVRDQGDAFLGLLDECTKDESKYVRQSAFALLGELVKSVPNLVLPNLDPLMVQLRANLDPAYDETCNNVCWAIGEIAMQAGGNLMAPYVEQLMRLLYDVLCTEDLDHILAQNVAITIGRLGTVCPEQVSEFLDDVLVPWCQALTLVEHPVEKENAFRGLVATLHANPAALGQEEGINYFALACSSWEGYHVDNSNETLHALANMLQTVKQQEAGAWRVMWATMAPDTQNALATLFGV